MKIHSYLSCALFFSALFLGERGGASTEAESIKPHLALSEKVNAQAQFELALSYLQNSNKEQAFIWMKKAADQGYIDALTELGFFYESGIGTDINLDEAIKYYKKAIDKGSIVADDRYHLLTLPLTPEKEVKLPDGFVFSQNLELFYIELLASSYEKVADYLDAYLEDGGRCTSHCLEYALAEARYFIPMKKLLPQYEEYMKEWRKAAERMVQLYINAPDGADYDEVSLTAKGYLNEVNARHPKAHQILSFDTAKQFINKKYSMHTRMHNLKLISNALDGGHLNYYAYHAEFLRSLALDLRLRYQEHSK